jgi:glucose/arabinose dehydrogenase
MPNTGKKISPQAQESAPKPSKRTCAAAQAFLRLSLESRLLNGRETGWLKGTGVVKGELADLVRKTSMQDAKRAPERLNSEEVKVVYLLRNSWLVGMLVLLLSACRASSADTTPTMQTQEPLASSTPAPSPLASQTSTATLTASPNPPTGTPTEPATLTATVQEQAKSMPDVAQYFWNTLITGLEAPVFLTVPDDGSSRFFIVEQAGRILIYQNGQLNNQAFLDISQEVSLASERGLLGLAFHPNYAQNGYFYVNYTDRNGNTVIARFQVSVQNPDRAVPQSEMHLLEVSQPFANHNGGMVAFGPDGYLYLGLGDGGSAGDPQNNAQSLDTLLGKILRIDVDSSEPYAIATDNPFVNGQGQPEIWAYGLRNPWRFSFDTATGDLYIGDVGQNQWEEIDYLPAGSPGGANFGWNYMEGNHPYRDNQPENLDLTAPVAEYNHSQGCSVTGGYVYRGANLPAWNGVYLFGDYCSGSIWGLIRLAQGSWEQQILFETGARISSFAQDLQGEIYLIDLTGSISRLESK